MFKSKTIEHNAAICHNEDDLRAALREIEEIEGDPTFFIEIDFPGIGKQRINIFDDVPLQIECSTED